MKRLHSINAAIVVSLLLLSVPAGAAEGEMKGGPKKVPAFETIKSLAGSWTGKETYRGRKGDGPIQVKYEVTSAGSAVIETLYPGTPREMVSVYYLDGSEVKMTHYCTLRNQPRLGLSSASKKGRQLNFTFIDATGMRSPADPHLGDFTLWAKDSNHLQLEKIQWSEGGEKKDVRKMNFVREK